MWERTKVILGVFFLSIGLVFFGVATGQTWERYAPKKPTVVDPVIVYGQPKEISISSIEVKLGIFPAKLVGQRWEATREGVSYLSSSPIPGEKGNSILYGHNWPSLLGKLPQVKVGDKITVVFEGGKTRSFTVTETKAVKPNGVEILKETTEAQITIYTCEGFLDQKRFVAVARLDG